MNMHNAWIAIEPHQPRGTPSFPDYVLELDGSPVRRSSAMADVCWILVVTSEGGFARAGRILRPTAWRSSELPSSELAGMLIGASHAYRQAKSESDIELVWTGPSSELVATRKTEQALLQVINTAREKLFLTSFVAYGVASIMTALAKAADCGIHISMLLESSDRHGGSVSIDGIARMREALPSAKVYFWRDRGGEFAGGKVHAKVAVCDEEICFISSASLTGHAMEKNMEAGVLIRGGALPRKLHNHLEALATIKILEV